MLGGATATLEKTYALAELSFAPLDEGQAGSDRIHPLLAEQGLSSVGVWDQLVSPLDESILQADALLVRAS